MKRFNLKFSSENLIYRRSVFYDNLKTIQELNAENTGVFYAVNAFSIYTGEEFDSKFKGYTELSKKPSKYTKLTGTPAKTIDWR